MGADNTPRTLLVIDDDEIICELIKDYFSTKTIQVLTSRSASDGLATCSRARIGVVLLDQRVPDAEGHTLCPLILGRNDQTKIIFITAYASFEGAVEAVKLGAYDYISKPFELEQLDRVVERAFRALDLEFVEQSLKHQRGKENEDIVIIGGEGFDELLRVADLAASADCPVLITGKTGTGKDLLAKRIHSRSAQRSAAFVEINCAAFPEGLVEAELFGHERGAFTGAVTSKKGIFEMVQGGTLLLNEIGEMALGLQAKLLSVVEGKKIKRLGGEMITPVDFRIMAATSVDLENVLGTSFREDLYYRLSVIRIHIPPLRDRRKDIPDLCRYLLNRIAEGREATMDECEIERLMEYDWPGNVRELGNVLERAFILQKGPSLHPSRLLSERRNGGPQGHSRVPSERNGVRTLIEVEKSYIEYALRRFSGNYARTARSLGISLSTLKRKVRDYELS